MKVELYTDGAATMFLEDSGWTRGPGGWSWCYVRDGEVQNESYGNKPVTTNQEMELTAIYQALLFAAELKPEEVIIYSDSAYCINILNSWAYGWERNGWTRKGGKEIVNLDLIKLIWGLFGELKRNDVVVSFKKVPGHSNNKWNNYVDKLAVTAKQELL